MWLFFLFAGDGLRIVFLSMNPGLPKRLQKKHRLEFSAMNSSFDRYWKTRCCYFDSNEYYYHTMMNSLAHAIAGFLDVPPPGRDTSHTSHRALLRQHAVAIELVPYYSREWPSEINQHISDLVNLPSMMHVSRLFSCVLESRPDLVWVNGNHMAAFLEKHESHHGTIQRDNRRNRLHYHKGSLNGVRLFRTGQLHSRQNLTIDEIRELARIAASL